MSSKSKRKKNKRQRTLKSIARHRKQIHQTKRSIEQLKQDEGVLEVLHDRLVEGDDLNVKEEAENLAISVWAYYKIKERDLKKKFCNGDWAEVISILDKDRKQRSIICDFVKEDRVSMIFGPKISSLCREAQIDIWKATISPKDGDEPILKTVEREDGLYMDFQYPDDWDDRHRNHCFVSRCIGGVTFKTVEGKIIAENCKWYHDGPKTIEINNHQYEALQADLKIDSDMLRTPYPVFRLKLPSNIMKRARSELDKFKLFDYVICSYEDPVFKMYMPGIDDSIYYFDALEKGKSLEEILMEDISRSKLIDNFTRDLLRVVWNLSLLMTNGYTKHTVRKKQLTSSNPYPRECDIEEILSFEQNVCAIGRMNQSEGHDDMPVDGVGKRPHWRRAHWRQQRCGPGGKNRRPVFIQDIFVRSDLFSGNISDTNTNYKKPGTDL